jgi:thiamine biosynthesis lipoprotein
MSCSGASPRVEPPRPARALLAACAAALLVAGCQRAPATTERVIPVFGTLVTVEIAAPEGPATRAALDRVEALYRELDRDWRSFGPGELGQVNERLARGEPATLSPRLALLVARSLDVSARSDGLFDPRVGRLVELWGFQDLAGRDPHGPPADAAVAATRAATIGRAELRLQGLTLTTTAPVRLELAGIAKGSALAAGAAALRAAGVRDALIAAGGDIVALGRRGDRPWRVGVRDPLGSGVLGSIELAPGEAAASSGNYERRYEAGGRVAHHVIDPRTGAPSRGAAGATVVGMDAELANAAALALMVGGPGRFEELAARLGADCALLVTDAGELVATPAMSRRLARP